MSSLVDIKGKERSGSTESSSTVVKGNSPICFLLQSSKTKHFIHYNDDLMISWLDGNLHALDWDWHEHCVSFYCLQKDIANNLSVHHYCYFYGCPSWSPLFFIPALMSLSSNEILTNPQHRILSLCGGEIWLPPEKGWCCQIAFYWPTTHKGYLHFISIQPEI